MLRMVMVMETLNPQVIELVSKYFNVTENQILELANSDGFKRIDNLDSDDPAELLEAVKAIKPIVLLLAGTAKSFFVKHNLKDLIDAVEDMLQYAVLGLTSEVDSEYQFIGLLLDSLMEEIPEFQQVMQQKQVS